MTTRKPKPHIDSKNDAPPRAEPATAPLSLAEFSRRGGHARAEALSPARRRAIAKAAIAARWRKPRPRPDRAA